MSGTENGDAQGGARAGFGPFAGYADEHRPLAAYAGLAASFGAALGGALVALHRADRLSDRLSAADIALAGVATHKVSRLLAKDKVTSVIRAPFVRYEGGSGQGEVSEEPRGRGLQLALGELLNCPFCLAQWVAAAFAVGLAGAPQTTRFLAAIYAAETIADGLQLAYAWGEDQL